MGQLTENSPKCLLEIFGRPLIEWQLKALREVGISELGIVTGYLAGQIDYDLTYFHNEEWASSNMVTSLLSAADWLQHSSCVVSYSDIVYSSDALTRLISSPGDIVLTFDPNWLELWQLRFDNPLIDAECFREENGMLQEIGGRASTTEDIRGQYMGLVKVTPAGWKSIEETLASLPPERVKSLDMTGLFSLMLERGVEIRAVPVRDAWVEVDTLEDLACYNQGSADYIRRAWLMGVNTT